MITTKMRTALLRRMQAACEGYDGRTLALEGNDRRAGDQLVIAGLAVRTRAGRYEVTLKGLRTDTKGTA
jgi:hypothetical protein